MLFFRLILLAGLVAVSCHAWSQASQPILDSTWVVQSCKSEPNRAGNPPDCQDPRKLLSDVTFSVAPDASGNHWLKLELQQPRMNISVPAIDLDQGKLPDGSPYATFSFDDFTAEGKVVTKQMQIELVRSNGEDTGDECTAKLEGRLGQDFASGGKYARQCQEDQLAYWSIDIRGSAKGQKEAELALGPPGDGHGTSTPP